MPDPRIPGIRASETPGWILVLRLIGAAVLCALPVLGILALALPHR